MAGDVQGWSEKRQKACRRGCDGKRAFWTRNEAKQDAKRRGRKKVLRLYTYHCTECGCWHQTRTETSDKL